MAFMADRNDIHKAWWAGQREHGKSTRTEEEMVTNQP